ncbi:thioredoxin family protein [Spirillospora sp. NPDC046719]
MQAKPLLVLACLLLSVTACGSAGPTGSSAPAGTAAAPSTPAGARPASTAEPVREGYDPARNAKADIAAALAQAKRDGRPVLLDFGADWCPDCVVLGRTFRSAEVRPVLARYHVVSVDVGRFDHNIRLARRYGVNLETSGIPALAVLSGSGKVRTVTNDGSFATARSLSPARVAAFLKRWR